MTGADEWDELFLEWGQDVDGNPLPLSVRTRESSGQLGPTFKPAESLPGLPQMPERKWVRGSDGNESVAQTAIYAPKDLAGHFTLGSRVTLADGRESTVLGVQTPDTLGLFAFVVVRVE